MTTTLATFTPTRDQEKLADLVEREGYYGAYWEPGVGKTAGTFNAVDQLLGPTEQCLVICPMGTMRHAWAQDAEHFGFDCEVIYDKNRARRLKTIANTSARFIVTNFDTFKNHRASFDVKNPAAFVVDESSVMKNPESQITQAILRHRFRDRQPRIGMLLSGTPAPNGPWELWSQLVFLELTRDRHYQWLYNYFAPVRQDVRVRGKIRSVIARWRPLDAWNDYATTKLPKRTWFLKAEDAVDLPDKRIIRVELTLDPKERKAYNEIEASLRVPDEDDGERTIRSRDAIMRLRTATGGFTYTKIGHSRFGMTKLVATQEIVEQFKPDEPVIVWAEFRQDHAALQVLFASKFPKRNVVSATGEQGESEVSDALHAFCNGASVLLAHPQTIGHGVTLVGCRYAIYYNMSFSPELYEQSAARIYRRGQTKAVTYYHLIGIDTIDEACFNVCQRKMKQSDALARMVADRGVA